MAETSTTNYGLVKPTAGTNEPVDVTQHLDDNWDKIDQDMNRFDEQRFTASGTWNKPARCKRVEVEVQGGGASGGGAAATGISQIALAGGGAGGGYAKKLFLATALSASETVDVGAGGAAAAAGANPGLNGSVSRFATGKAYVVTANGGTGGTGGGAGAGNGNIAGGDGGTATGGDINITGSDGGNAIHNNTFAHATGYGGGSFLAGLSRADVVSGTGFAGSDYGGGSSGAVNYLQSTAAKASTPGGNGIVIVRSYY